MKKILLFSLIASASAMAVAQERGRVLSVTPIIEQVAVPRQVCGNETVYTGRCWALSRAVQPAMPSAVAVAALPPRRLA